MTYSERNDVIRFFESQISELEGLIFEPDGNFSESNITDKFKFNTSSARATGVNVLVKAVREVEIKVKHSEELEAMFPDEPIFSEFKRRFARCGQHLLAMINKMEEWD